MTSRVNRSRLFLDAVDSAPADPAAVEAYAAALDEGWAQPGRLYAESTRAQRMLDEAREEVATLLGSRPAHTHFTPSPAIAAERIVMGISAARRGRMRGLVSAAEPSAITNAARFMCTDGVATAPIDREGMLDIDAFTQAVSHGDIAFAAVSHANPEVGTLQPIGDAYAAALSVKVPLVVDASASIGRIRPPKTWDALIANPAAWGCPGSLGVLALTPELRWLPEWADGAPWAPGSTNIPAAVAAAAALRSRHRAMLDGSEDTLRAQSTDLAAALRRIPHTVVLGRPGNTLPHVVAVTFVYADAVAVGRALDEAGIAVSAGCSCGAQPTSRCEILAAMGVMTHGLVRFGLHDGVDARGVARAVEAVQSSVAQVRAQVGAPA